MFSSWQCKVGAQPCVATAYLWFSPHLASFGVGLRQFASAGAVISSAQMITTQTGGSICQVVGIVVLAAVFSFLLLLFVVLFRYVRPSSAHKKVAWSKCDGWESLDPHHAGDDHLEELVASHSRLQRAIAITRSSMNGAWLHRWNPLFEDYKSSRFRWMGLMVTLSVNAAIGVILGFGLHPLGAGSCSVEQVTV